MAMGPKKVPNTPTARRGDSSAKELWQAIMILLHPMLQMALPGAVSVFFSPQKSQCKDSCSSKNTKLGFSSGLFH